MTSTCIINLNKDQNFDGLFTISDVYRFCGEIIYMPGRLFVNLIAETEVGVFFEVAYSSCSSWITLTLSLCMWILFSVIIAKLES